jgi:hypothetical protein
VAGLISFHSPKKMRKPGCPRSVIGIDEKAGGERQ